MMCVQIQATLVERAEEKAAETGKEHYMYITYLSILAEL